MGSPQKAAGVAQAALGLLRHRAAAMSLWTIVPVRGLAAGKTRLAEVLDPGQRYALNLMLLGRALDAVAEAQGGLSRCIIAGAGAGTPARRAGARRGRPGRPCEFSGLNAGARGAPADIAACMKAWPGRICTTACRQQAWPSTTTASPQHPGAGGRGGDWPRARATAPLPPASQCVRVRRKTACSSAAAPAPRDAEPLILGRRYRHPFELFRGTTYYEVGGGVCLGRCRQACRAAGLLIVRPHRARANPSQVHTLQQGVRARSLRAGAMLPASRCRCQPHTGLRGLAAIKPADS